MTKHVGAKFKYLKNEKCFKGEIKICFHHFKSFFIVANNFSNLFLIHGIGAKLASNWEKNMMQSGSPMELNFEDPEMKKMGSFVFFQSYGH